MKKHVISRKLSRLWLHTSNSCEMAISVTRFKLLHSRNNCDTFFFLIKATTKYNRASETNAPKYVQTFPFLHCALRNLLSDFSLASRIRTINQIESTRCERACWFTRAFSRWPPRLVDTTGQLVLSWIYNFFFPPLINKPRLNGSAVQLQIFADCRRSKFYLLLCNCILAGASPYWFPWLIVIHGAAH